MKVPTEFDDGSQPREYVLTRLHDFGVGVLECDEQDWYELIDCNGDPVIVHLVDPVDYRQIAYLWRRFGKMHGMLITDFVPPKRLS